MAIKAIIPGKTRDFVSKLDTGDTPTIWKLGTLTSRDKGAIRDSVTSFSFKRKEDGTVDAGDADTKIERSKMSFEAVRRGLKGWKNFLHPDTDEPVPFKTIKRDLPGGVRSEIIPNELLDMIPLEVVDELAEEIMKDNSVDDKDVGNSPAPSSEG